MVPVLGLLTAGCGPPEPTLPAAPADDPLPVDVRVTASGAIACADPDARATLGPWLLRDDTLGWPEAANVGLPNAAFGAVVADLDGDAPLDVFLPGVPLPARLYLGGADGWRDASAENLPGAVEFATAASAVDADADGDLDLWVGVAIGSDRLLLNDGRGAFTDGTPAAWAGAVPHVARGGSWADMDGDGDLDLFVYSNRGGEVCDGDPPDANLLWENLGDGTFRDVRDRLPASMAEGYVQAAGWHDLDGDLDPDLYVVNDFGPMFRGNQVARNDGGVLVDAGAGSGLDLVGFGMGIAVADLDDDALPDLLVSDWDRLWLLDSDGPMTWYDTAPSVGLTPLDDARHASWGGVFGDVDGDADLDIAVAFGQLPGPDFVDTADPCSTLFPSNPASQPDALYLRQADGSHVQAAEAWGFADAGMNRGVVLADMDGDGGLDALVRGVDTPARLHTSRCGAEAWLEVHLRAPPPDTSAVGARVEVEAGGRVQRRWVEIGGTSIGGSAPTTLHFGLGDAATVDAVTITWRDGRTSEVTGLEPRQRVEIERVE